jgi:hypothetical protein
MDFGAPPNAPAPAPAPAQQPGAFAAPAAAITEVREKVADTMNTAVDSVKSMVTRFDSKRAMTIVLTTLAVIAVATLVVVTIWYFMKKEAVRTLSFLLPDSKSPILGTEYKKLVGAEIPRAFNGKRTTISFWVYIHDIDRYKGLYRHLWHRGDKSVQGASPLVFLDSNTNRLHVRFEKIDKATQSLSMTQPFDTTVTASVKDQAGGQALRAGFKGKVTAPLSKALDLDLATRGITIDYIPIQRWVHVAIVVNEEVNGGMIYAYLDGELVKQEVSGSTVSRDVTVTGTWTGQATPASIQTTLKVEKKYQELNLDKPGDIYVGGSAIEQDVGPGFSGLVASLTFFNHDLNAKDIYRIYEAGPVDNLAAKLGLPAYGVRSPIYRIS